jgi:hypothetical protein
LRFRPSPGSESVSAFNFRSSKNRLCQDWLRRSSLRNPKATNQLEATISRVSREQCYITSNCQAFQKLCARGNHHCGLSSIPLG